MVNLFRSDSKKKRENSTTKSKSTTKPTVISPDDNDEKRSYVYQEQEQEQFLLQQDIELDFWKNKAEEAKRIHDSERLLYQETFIANNKLKREVARLDRWVVHLQNANDKAAQDLIQNLKTIEELKVEWEEVCQNFCDGSTHRKLTVENELLRTQVKELQKFIADYNKSRRKSEQLRRDAENKNKFCDLEQLKIDLEHLTIALRKTTSLQASNFIINEEAAKQLLDQYDVKYYPGEHLPRNLISAALQRRIIETVLNRMNAYFDNSVRPNDNDNSEIDWSAQILHQKSTYEDSSNKENAIDRQIITTMEALAEQFTIFSKTNPDAKILSEDSKIQLRQLIFNLLGSRTFETSDSLVIDSICTEILEGLEQIRTVPSRKQRALLKKQDEQTIRQCISTLFFKLIAQHPTLHIEWLPKRTPVNESIMDLTWIDDDESIEICSFPLIKVTKTDEIVFKAHVEASSEGTKCGDDVGLISMIELDDDNSNEVKENEEEKHKEFSPSLKNEKKVAETKSIITDIPQFTEEPLPIKPTITDIPQFTEEPLPIKPTTETHTKRKEPIHVTKITIPKKTSKTITKSSSTSVLTTKPIPVTPTKPKKAIRPPSPSRRQSSYIGSLASWATSYVPPVVQDTVQTNITKIEEYLPKSVQSKLDQYIPYLPFSQNNK
ncbi:1519_t:CDS:2 [Ambispora leptoticha]|uniref:1519_t:CDS:1 n=1 Tax=Ambispora leptoticha TaxID=144679 RepID=A0A9N8WJN7_9GLOM|nr:1519_t:CDS:2 [Ambispora leptoticha]